MNPEEFDLDRSVQAAWSQFEASLTDVVASMDESADLRIDADDPVENPGAGYVIFHLSAPGEVTATAAGDAHLDADTPLGAEQEAALLAAGWQPADGDYTMTRPQERSDELAHASVVALADAFGVQHPVFLVPDQLAEVLIAGEDVELPLEETTVPVPKSAAQLDALIRTTLVSALGHAPLRDDDGDYAIRVGSSMVFVRAAADAREVIVFAVVVREVDGRSRAMEILNDFNTDARFVRFELIRDRVFIQMSLFAQPFVAEHLRQAVRLVSELADGIDESLAQRLGGRTTFSSETE